MLVKDTIQRCKGLALAISIIGGLNLKNDEEWRDVIKIISEEDFLSQAVTHDYDFNLFGTFQLSVNQLDEYDQQLFRLLGVFNPVQIPLESIISLWTSKSNNKLKTIARLKKLNQRSLLKFIDGPRLVR